MIHNFKTLKVGKTKLTTHKTYSKMASDPTSTIITPDTPIKATMYYQKLERKPGKNQ